MLFLVPSIFFDPPPPYPDVPSPFLSCREFHKGTKTPPPKYENWFMDETFKDNLDVK